MNSNSYSITMSSILNNKNYYSWVPVNSTGKVSNGCIRDLEFNPYLHQKLIGRSLKLSQKKKKKKPQTWTTLASRQTVDLVK